MALRENGKPNKCEYPTSPGKWCVRYASFRVREVATPHAYYLCRQHAMEAIDAAETTMAEELEELERSALKWSLKR